MRDDPERFATFVVGAFLVAYYLGLALQTARVWRRVRRCPIAAFTTGGTRNWLHLCAAAAWPLPALAWAHAPALFARLPRAAPLDNWAGRLGGLLCLCLSAAVIGSAAHELGDNWRMGIEEPPGSAPAAASALVTSGIYGAIRHPMYAAGWLALLGIFLLAPNLLFAILWAAGAAGVLTLARREEEHLERALGEKYRLYERHTGRFFPLFF